MVRNDTGANSKRKRKALRHSLLVDVCDNISPGLSWPPKMTTICPLGPSAVSPITSLLDNFSDELMKMLPTKIPIAQ